MSKNDYKKYKYITLKVDSIGTEEIAFVNKWAKSCGYIKRPSVEAIQTIVFNLVHSGYVRYFNSDDINDEKEIARRIAQSLYDSLGKEE
jgi:hypothetical protein